MILKGYINYWKRGRVMFEGYCIKCGGIMVFMGKVLLVSPPKYVYQCNSCNHTHVEGKKVDV